EMLSIVLLALAGRFIGFAQSTLESGTPLTVDRALSYIADTVGLFAHPNHLAFLLGVLSVAALIRIAIAYANRSVLLILKEHAGIDANELSWAQRAVRLPVAVLYRALSGIATLIGGLALAISFRLFNPEVAFRTSELSRRMLGSLSAQTGRTAVGIGEGLRSVWCGRNVSAAVNAGGCIIALWIAIYELSHIAEQNPELLTKTAVAVDVTTIAIAPLVLKRRSQPLRANHAPAQLNRGAGSAFY